MSLGGHQICIGQTGKRGKSISLMGIKPWFVQHIAILSVGITVLAVLTDDVTLDITELLSVTCHVFRKVHPTVGSEFLTAYHEVLQILRMKRHNLK